MTDPRLATQAARHAAEADTPPSGDSGERAWTEFYICNDQPLGPSTSLLYLTTYDGGRCAPPGNAYTLADPDEDGPFAGNAQSITVAEAGLYEVQAKAYFRSNDPAAEVDPDLTVLRCLLMSEGRSVETGAVGPSWDWDSQSVVPAELFLKSGAYLTVTSRIVQPLNAGEQIAVEASVRLYKTDEIMTDNEFVGLVSAKGGPVAVRRLGPIPSGLTT